MDNGEEDFGADYEQDSRGNTAEQSPALQSKPNFEINIIRGDTTLLLACSFLQDPVQEGDYRKCSQSHIISNEIITETLD